MQAVAPQNSCQTALGAAHGVCGVVVPVLLPQCVCLSQVQACSCQCGLSSPPELLDALRVLGRHLGVKSSKVPGGVVPWCEGDNAQVQS